MALNPAFANPTTRKLPLAFGYIMGSGDMVLSTVALDGSQYALFLLGEGEWDGYEMMSTFPVTASGSQTAIPPHMVWAKKVVNNAQTYTSGIYFNTHTQATWYDYPGFQWGAPSLNFHAGRYTPIGTVIPTIDPTTGLPPVNSSQSYGPDQDYDGWFSQFPTVTPPQSFSGIAYVIFCVPGMPSYARGVPSGQTISGAAVWRTTRCRIFDGYGNVVSYGFTCNPAWHKVEVLLRTKIRPQQPPISGLTYAEKACFDWPSICELAARNDYILPNGNPRFVGSYIFASDASLTNMMETMCRVDRSYQRVDGGKIYLIGDDARASVFIASAKHLIPNSLKLDKKDLSKAPNVFVPSYRDLDMPAVCQVISMTRNGMWSFRDGEAFGMSVFTATTPSPFANSSFMYYGGCSDPSFEGVYPVWVVDGDPYPEGADYPNNTYSANTLPEGTPIATVTGGYLGSDDAHFSVRAPTNVQHRSAQRIVPRQAPGLTAQPQIKHVVYDCGNSTFDQTNRLMKFERDRALGTDIGAGWVAPIGGTLSLYYECIDKNGAQLPNVRAHDVITLDEWLTPEFTGDYEIEEMALSAPTENTLGQVDLKIHAYNRNAYTDISDDPGNYYKSVPNSSLQFTGFPSVTYPAWILQATLNISLVDGGLTIAIPDLSIQVMGKTSPTDYPSFSVSGIPPATPPSGGDSTLFSALLAELRSQPTSQIALYVTDPSGIGTSPTYGWIAGEPLPADYIPGTDYPGGWVSGPSYFPRPSSGSMLVAVGSFTAP
jgi:hypothetical protein